MFAWHYKFARSEGCTGYGNALLQCITLHCTRLHCTALHCTALVQYITLHCTALHWCNAIHCTVLQNIKLNWTTLHCTDLYHTTSSWAALHYTALIWTELKGGNCSFHTPARPSTWKLKQKNIHSNNVISYFQHPWP